MIIHWYRLQIALLNNSALCTNQRLQNDNKKVTECYEFIKVKKTGNEKMALLSELFWKCQKMALEKGSQKNYGQIIQMQQIEIVFAQMWEKKFKKRAWKI